MNMENFKSNEINELVTAVVETIKSIDGVNKNSTVGEGTRSEYKGVKDQDVKQTVGKAMAANDLCMIPIDIEEKREVYRWQDGNYQKQQVIYSIKAKYLLSHKSGQWIIVTGIGDGVDSQDKAAGKATTYALKNAMLYTFAVPTGNIDDADTQHSENIDAPKQVKQTDKKKGGEFDVTHEGFNNAIEALEAGKSTVEKIVAYYDVTPMALTAIKAAELKFKSKQK